MRSAPSATHASGQISAPPIHARTERSLFNVNIIDAMNPTTYQPAAIPADAALTGSPPQSGAARRPA
jgi:hypothetical protein